MPIFSCAGVPGCGFTLKIAATVSGVSALIAPADIAYPRGAILSDAGTAAQFALAIGITVTAIYVAGILIRRTPSLFGAGLDSWLVAALYLGALIPLFLIG